MTEQYTPTTEQVRQHYGESVSWNRTCGNLGQDEEWDKAKADFNRWYAAEIAGAKAEALRDAANVVRSMYGPGSATVAFLEERADQIEGAAEPLPAGTSLDDITTPGLRETKGLGGVVPVAEEQSTKPDGEHRVRERRTYDQDGTYDEIVRADCRVHIERLNDNDWMLAINKPDGTAEVYGITGVIYDNYEIGPNDADQSGWPTDPGGPVDPHQKATTTDD